MNWQSLNDLEMAPEVAAVIGEVPRRWGRMDLASRVALVAVARVLRARGLVAGTRVDGDKCVGLVVATIDGCMLTDLGFSRGLAAGDVSPMLFGYTLANIPLAEAAGHFGLTGPVYAVYGAEAAAREQAAGWLKPSGPADMMITGGINIPANGDAPSVKLEVLVTNDADGVSSYISFKE